MKQTEKVKHKCFK